MIFLHRTQGFHYSRKEGKHMGNLHNAAVVITGAGKGIGRAIAEELGGHGAKVIVNYSRSKAEAEAVAAHLLQNGAAAAIAVQADVSDAQQANALVEEAVRLFGRIDVLVNNAGITIDRTMKKMTVEDWDRVIQTNLSSCFYTARAAQSYMMEQKSGTIINISSFVGQMGNFGQANYSAAKAGIIGFTKTAALELARYNVTVNAICPGFIETDMFANVPDKVRESIVKRIPLGRIGTPQEIAAAVSYLVLHGDYITGQTLNINGGIYM
jgi:acetoacetyl-CoA reductase